MSLNDYEEQKTLGQGSYGKVVKVKDKRNGFIYAMKKINLNYSDDEERKSSLNEIRLLYSLNHPNIIRYKEAFFEPSNCLNIVIEYAGDGDLSQKVNMNKKYHKRFDENTIWDWVIQLIIGIYYLHISNCIHRDLKCANIFLKKNGRIKIGDLGVSKFLKKDFAETIIGTPLYIAPEMLKDLPYDYKVDIWSLGCIVYELCALEPPFNGRNVNELYKNIKAGRYIPIPNVYSNDLKKIIALMLQTNPNNRISSEELFNLPIIKSKIYKNYSKYQELIEKIKKPEIIGTILPQQKLPKKQVISKGNKSRNVSKNKSKSKGKKPPSSDRKKKVIDKKYDNLNYNQHYNKNNYQKNFDEYSERDYDNKRALHNNYIKEPSFYSKNSEQNDYSEYNTRDYDNQTHQNYYYNEQPSFFSKITEQNKYSKYNTRDYDNQTHQNYDYNIPPSYNIKNNIERNYTNNNNMDYNDKKNKKNKFYNLLKDSFGPIKKASYYDYDEFRPINNANIYNNYNNYNQIESNYNMDAISKYDY